jgi:hypothetical protein
MSLLLRSQIRLEEGAPILGLQTAPLHLPVKLPEPRIGAGMDLVLTDGMDMHRDEHISLPHCRNVQGC